MLLQTVRFLLLGLIASHAAFADVPSCKTQIGGYAKIYSRIDQNQDGLLAKDEVMAEYESLARTYTAMGPLTGIMAKPFDLNGDGKFNLVDFLAYLNVVNDKTNCAPGHIRFFAMLDQDNNGVIRVWEHVAVDGFIALAFSKRHYDLRYDLNRDRALTYDDNMLAARVFELYGTR